MRTGQYVAKVHWPCLHECLAEFCGNGRGRAGGTATEPANGRMNLLLQDIQSLQCRSVIVANSGLIAVCRREHKWCAVIVLDSITGEAIGHKLGPHANVDGKLGLSLD